VGNGKCIIGEKITVAMVQSLYKRTEEVLPYTGHLVVDECHRAPSRTFNEAVSAFDSYYMTGLSATPFRRDKLSNLIFWYLGDNAHEIDKSLLEAQGDILKAEIIFRETEFQSLIDASVYYTKLMGELILDSARNELIISDILKELKTVKGTILVLSDRKMHCEIIRSLLSSKHGIDSHLMTGDLSIQERNDVLEDLKQGGVKILIATSQLIGEGFDAPGLSTLFLIYPVKFQGRLIQYIGRILRPAPGKKNARVFDYVDSRVGVLEAAARSRSNVYYS
jgi:superfamily II DNA or RNA helicase